MATDALDPAGVYLGTTGGLLFGSFDGGAHWTRISADLPPVRSLETSLIG
jgi:hypothetical protein